MDKKDLLLCFIIVLLIYILCYVYLIVDRLETLQKTAFLILQYQNQ
jgi:Tfp pilus assembly protein PilO